MTSGYLVGWVKFDGGEYHSFEYATVTERREMARGWVPVGRRGWIPLYARDGSER